MLYHGRTKLLLVSIHIDDSPQAVPLGAAMLASAIKAAPGLSGRVEPVLLDLRLGQSAAACTALILAGRPDAVGFSLCVWNRGQALATVRLLKRERPELLLFAGGPEASADTAGVLAAGGLDFVIPGEAELALPAALEALLDGSSPRELPGAAFRLADGTHRIPPPAFVADLAGLPSPFLDGTLEPAAYPGLLWEFSRGCPFRCDFCFESRGAAGVRRFPLERLEAELDRFVSAGVSQVFVLDPTFNVDLKRAKRILKLIGKKAPLVHFSFEVRSEFIDRELAGLFAGITCSVQIGLQSADPAELAGLGRDFDPDDFREKILLLHEAGVVYGFDLMYGLPGQNLAGFRASLDYALGLAPNHLDLFPLAVLPGTRLAETAAGLGLEHLPEAPYTVVSTDGMSAAELSQAAGLAEACRLLYVRAGAVPWFQLTLDALDLSPSELLASFAEWLKARPVVAPAAKMPEQAAAGLAKDFLAREFAMRGRPELSAMAVDLVEWFAVSDRLLETDAAQASAGLSARFEHDPAELGRQLEAGLRDLAELAFFVPRRPGVRRVRLIDGELSFENDQTGS